MLALADISEELLRRERSTDDAPRRLLHGEKEAFSFEHSESLRGGVARACELAGAPNSWTVLREMGLKHRNRVLVSEDPDIDVGALADALGVSREDVMARRYDEANNGARDFFGMLVPAGSIESRLRRFSPTFLRTHHYHLAAWELKFLPFCPETWDMLLSFCDACKSAPCQMQAWTRTVTPVDRCDECGRKLADRVTGSVSEELRPTLEIIARLVRTTNEERDSVFEILPPALRQSTPQALLNVILGLAKHIKASALSTFDTPQVARLHRACAALENWPKGLERLEFSASQNGQTLPPLLQDYASLGAIPAFKAAVREYSDKGSVETTAEYSSNGNKGIHVVGIREASALAGLDDDVLRSIWEARLVTRRYRAHGARLLPAFDLEELKRFAKAWKARASAATVAYRFGLPTYAIEQCATLQVLRPSALSVPGSGYYFLKDVIDKFSISLMSHRANPVGSMISLRDAMRIVSGGLKPWGGVLNAIKQGVLPAILREGPETHLAKRLLVDKVAIAKLITEIAAENLEPVIGLSPMVTQTDALEVLNSSATSLGLLEGIVSTGINPKLFPLQQILDRAKTVVATAEVAERMDLDPTRTFRLLRAARVREIVPGGWDRTHAFELIRRATTLRDSQLSLDI